MVSPDALFTGGASLAGGLYAQYATDERQKDAQAFNAQQAANQMQFQKEMRNTAYQAAMKDMRKAGLNPILAYQKGPASSPSGAMAQTDYKEVRDVLTPAISSAMQARRLEQELQNMDEQNKNLRETNKLIGAQTTQANATTAKTVADTAISSEMLKEAQRKGEIAGIDQKFYQSTIGTILRNIGLGIGEVNPITRTIPRPYIHVTRD